MDMNGLEARQTNSQWQAGGLPGFHYIEAAAHMGQMLKVGAGVRVMLKSGTLPFPVHTALKGWHHVAPREHFGSARIKAGKRSTGLWARTWPQGRH